MTKEALKDLLKEPVQMAIGQASTCWGNLGGAGEFQSHEAIKISENLLEKIIELLTDKDIS